MFRNTRIGFVGIGQMGQGILKGLVASGQVAADNLYVTDIDARRLKQIEECGVHTILTDGANSGAKELAKLTDVLVIAVKPQLASHILNSLAGEVRPNQLIVSIMGGIPIDFIEKALPENPVLRVMPNTPVMVRKGVSGIVLGNKVDERLRELGVGLFDLLGGTYLLDESLIDPLTGLCGCSPAFAYMFIDALAMGGVERGLPAEDSIRMAAQAMAGAAEMVLSTGRHPGELAANVCTPAGSTIAGVHALEEKAFKGVVMGALCKACDRMLDVGKKV